MIRLLARRSAERFDSLVDGASTGTPPRDADARDAELLDLVSALRSVPSPQPRPEFVSSLRERLVLAAETELAPVAAAARDRDVTTRLTVQPTRTRRERRVGVALGAVAVIGATSSVAVASQGAIPGDALYPVKRAIENTQAGFSVGDDAKGQTLLGNASGRLEELDELTRQAEPDADLVRGTLVTFADQATQASDLLIADYQATGDEESLQELQGFAGDSLETLAAVEPAVPAAAHGALEDAAETVAAISAAAANLCPTCGEPISEMPPQLVAAAAGVVDDVAGALAGAAPSPAPAPGAQPTGPAAGGGQSVGAGPSGGEDDGRPSATDPPASPVVVPSGAPTTTEPEQPGGLGGLLPSTGGGKGDKDDKGGKGGKGGPDLGPVTDTVDEVVDDVVEGVNGLLGGVTGGGTGGGTGGLTGGLTGTGQ